MTSLWIRGAMFTVMAPGIVGGAVPFWLDPNRHPGDAAMAGWALTVAGAIIYLLCLRRFLAAGGTPAIFFTRPARFIIGEEPGDVVASGLYARSRNPMYLGVLLAVSGQALLFSSRPIAIYAAALAAVFHFVVVLIEEPHLRAERGAPYEAYIERVPRWLGRARR